MLHIEISGDATPIQLRAAQAALSVLLGTTASTTTAIATVDLQTGDVDKSIPEQVGDGKAAALKDLPPMPTAVAVPIAGAEGQAAPIAPAIPAPPATPGELAERLMAGETARVAAEELPSIVPPPGVAVDVNGLPHDLRIHAATVGTNKDGSWRYKRGVDPALVAAVEAELKAIMAAPIPEASAVVDAAAAFGASATGSVPPAPPVADNIIPPPPVPVATPPASNMPEFARVMRVVVDKQKAGTVTASTVDEIAKSLGLTSVRDLGKRPDLIPAFEALLP